MLRIVRTIRVKLPAESCTMPCFSWMRWDFILILKVFYSSPLVLPYGFIVGYNDEATGGGKTLRNVGIRPSIIVVVVVCSVLCSGID